MTNMKNFQQIDSFKEYSESYLKNKPPDCILFSEDGAQFKTHKELFGQTEFMRKILKNTNCCNVIEIICPCSQYELSEIIEFIKSGRIEYGKNPQPILENLKTILGFEVQSGFPRNFRFDNQKDTVAENDCFPKTNKNEHLENMSNEHTFVNPYIMTRIKEEEETRGL